MTQSNSAFGIVAAGLKSRDESGYGQTRSNHTLLMYGCHPSYRHHPPIQEAGVSDR